MIYDVLFHPLHPRYTGYPMKIAFIHNDKKLGTGAHFINDLIASRLHEIGIEVKNFYPKSPLVDPPVHLRGLGNILFFYSLLEHKNQILKFDLVQGTTYTPLAFLAFPIPVVSHFGSTSWGFLDAVPQAKDLDAASRKIWAELRDAGVINQLNIMTRRPLRDVAEIERFVATRADAVIATSQIVRQDLLRAGVDEKNIHLVPNAIEDYWFDRKPLRIHASPSLVFLGRLGSDPFTLKLKGLDRLVDLYRRFKRVPKHTIGMTTNKALIEFMDARINTHTFYANLKKEEIPTLLNALAGSILLVTSRYEGFSLSLIEGMSQGLIPVTYAVGIAPEVITHGKNGFLVQNQTEATRAIQYIIGLSTEKRRELAEAARMSAKPFNSRMISKRLLAVYNQVIKKPRNKK